MKKRNIILTIVIVVIVIGVGAYLVMNFVLMPTEEPEKAEGTGETPTGDSHTATKAYLACGNSVTFTYKGSSVTYGTVVHNDECWLDRNLGASQVATSPTDAESYGDLFQWGRSDDGHQTRSSGATTILSITDNPGHANFIYGMGSPYDWRSSQNNNLWQGVSGANNPCPSGWRLPTAAEWDVEISSWSSNDSTGAFASPLKLTLSGFRHYETAHITTIGSYGYYWSSTVSGTSAYNLGLYSDGTTMIPFSRAFAFSVRCLKD